MARAIRRVSEGTSFRQLEMPVVEAPLTLPRDLRVHHLMGAGDPYVVLSFHMPRATIPAGLTDAEGAVLLLLLHGLPSASIAYVRGTSCRTVANQLASIYRKLGVSSRVELAARASRGSS